MLRYNNTLVLQCQTHNVTIFQKGENKFTVSSFELRVTWIPAFAGMTTCGLSVTGYNVQRVYYSTMVLFSLSVEVPESDFLGFPQKYILRLKTTNSDKWVKNGDLF
jgi:hypothetical protein